MRKPPMTKVPNGVCRSLSLVSNAIHSMKGAIGKIKTRKLNRPSKFTEYIMDGTPERAGFSFA